LAPFGPNGRASTDGRRRAAVFIAFVAACAAMEFPDSRDEVVTGPHCGAAVTNRAHNGIAETYY